MKTPDTRAAARPRRLLFQKYFTALFVAVVVPLLANGASEAWFGYRDQREVLSQRLHAEARSAAGKIQGFLDDITDQLQWTVQLPWRDGMDERHRFDVLRLMRQVPAVLEVTLVDGQGIERLHVSRVDPDVVNGGADRNSDPAVYGARQDESTVVVGMLTYQVDPPRGTGHQHRLLQKLIAVCLNGTLLNLPHDYLLHRYVLWLVPTLPLP